MKHSLPAFVFWPYAPSADLPSGAASAIGSKKTKNSLPKGARSAERGFLLLLLLPTLLLALAFLAGTVKVIQFSQQRIAMQSRLDLCALRLVQARRELAVSLVAQNRVIRTTALGIAMARGLSILGGPAGKLLGTLGEAGLLRANQAAAAWQEAKVAHLQAKELLLLRCAPTPYSQKLAACWAQPSIRQALRRAPALFPDVKGAMEFVAAPLGRARCEGGKLSTKMRLEGDQKLIHANFTDAYEQ